MATTTGSPAPSAPTRIPSTPLTRPPAARPLGPDLVRAEWTKLRTVRSTWWALALTAAGMVGLGALFATRYGVGGISPAERAGFDPAAYSLSGFFLAQLAVGVLGVLAITSEYQTGSIRATLTGTPNGCPCLPPKRSCWRPSPPWSGSPRHLRPSSSARPSWPTRACRLTSPTPASSVRYSAPGST